MNAEKLTACCEAASTRRPATTHNQSRHAPKLPSCSHRNPVRHHSPHPTCKNDLLVEVVDRISLLLEKVNGSQSIDPLTVKVSGTRAGSAVSRNRKGHCHRCDASSSPPQTSAASVARPLSIPDEQQTDACVGMRHDKGTTKPQKSSRASWRSLTSGVAPPHETVELACASSPRQRTSVRTMQQTCSPPEGCMSCALRTRGGGKPVVPVPKGGAVKNASNSPRLTSKSSPSCSTTRDLTRVARLEVGLQKSSQKNKALKNENAHLLQALHQVQTEAKQTKRLLDDCREQLAAREDALNAKVLRQAAEDQTTASVCDEPQYFSCCDTAALHAAALAGDRARHQADLLHEATQKLEDEMRNLKKRMVTLSTKVTEQNTAISNRDAQLSKAEKQLSRERKVSSRLRKFYLQTSHRNKSLAHENTALNETLLDLELKLCRPHTLWELAHRSALSPCHNGRSARRRGDCHRQASTIDTIARALLTEKKRTQEMQKSLDRYTERLLADIGRRPRAKCVLSQERGNQTCSRRAAFGVKERPLDSGVNGSKHLFASACIESVAEQDTSAGNPLRVCAQHDKGVAQGRHSCLRLALACLSQETRSELIRLLQIQVADDPSPSPGDKNSRRRSRSCSRTGAHARPPHRPEAALQLTHRLCRSLRDSAAVNRDTSGGVCHSGQDSLTGRGRSSRRAKGDLGQIRPADGSPNDGCSFVNRGNSSSAWGRDSSEGAEDGGTACDRSERPISAQLSCALPDESHCRSPSRNCCHLGGPPSELATNEHNDTPCCTLPWDHSHAVDSSRSSIAGSIRSACSDISHNQGGQDEPCLPCSPFSSQAPSRPIPYHETPLEESGAAVSMPTPLPPSPATELPPSSALASSHLSPSPGHMPPSPMSHTNPLAAPGQGGESNAYLPATQQPGARRMPVRATAGHVPKSPPPMIAASRADCRLQHPPCCSPQPGITLHSCPRVGAACHNHIRVPRSTLLSSSPSSLDSSTLERDCTRTDLCSGAGISTSCVGCCLCPQALKHGCGGRAAVTSCWTELRETCSCPARVTGNTPRHAVRCGGVAHLQAQPHCGCLRLGSRGVSAARGSACGCEASASIDSLPSETLPSSCAVEAAGHVSRCPSSSFLLCPEPSQLCIRKEGNALEGCVSWDLPPQIQVSLQSDT
ncbi:hypothetical protein BESB_071100 [Besnoitia besnoiti]|uniref:Uncharacterized protein n=1 Tax=Besnoitia besnoiti TaxID=94643 RepID=A0A2A9M660_BESBE|nr:uncharacterized protein BESB_071100 [Besnoitia besnoiti]PFH33958.1 hypothetical protein BESB_071100 [Besnoitia besnoiti]